ncbi:MAG: GTPase [Clostridia bacterium]|nr:GTPase [Clostridia bacterium]
MEDIGVYLFLGFLESGKTKFIQETLEDPRMDTGERTLLLVCEEGEEEYNPDNFKVKYVTKVTLESAEELTADNLQSLTDKYKVQRVVVEYNGTWLLQQFFDAMPESWVINQIMTFFDANTFLNYNRNMRQLVFDKMQMTQMVVFNRFKGEYDKLDFHKVVRGVSRRPDIVYEYVGGKAEFDEIEDPMPFDVNAPVIEIADKDFAWFYSDLAEKTDTYIGKTVKFKGMAAVSKKMPEGCAVLGRHIMTCCEADIAYDGFAVKLGKTAEEVKTCDWFIVTAKIAFEYNGVYRGEGPVLIAEKLEPCDAPEELVVTYN